MEGVRVVMVQLASVCINQMEAVLLQGRELSRPAGGAEGEGEPRENNHGLLCSYLIVNVINSKIISEYMWHA